MKKSLKFLYIDDDPDYLVLIESFLKSMGHEIVKCENPLNGIEIFKKEEFDFILLDYYMPELNGLETLKILKSINNSVPVVMLTASSDVGIIVEAVKNGAIDFLIKPLDSEYFNEKIQHFSKYLFLEKENVHLKSQIEETFKYKSLIGKSSLMKKIYKVVDKIASLDTTVLITGDSGTGKELIAKAIHYNGNKSDYFFIPIDCSLLNANLIESELFGHTKGAFTGAGQKKDGLLLAANNGTAFFDEIGELPLEMQSKLLRALQEKEIRPVGSNIPIKINCRIVAASNKNLAEEVKKGNFREDLYYRLNVINIQTPALLDRKEDIPLLVDHFLVKYQSENIITISKQALKAIVDYDWPGNVRELENCIERAIALGETNEISVSDLPNFLSIIESTIDNTGENLLTMEDFEINAIKNALSLAKGNKVKAAKILKIGKSTLYNKIEQYNLI